VRIYRLIYANNEVIACTDVSSNVGLNGIYHYEHKGGKLIYAIVKAESEENATTIGNFITQEVSAMLYGKDVETA
jgi:hypothetical protein